MEPPSAERRLGCALGVSNVVITLPLLPQDADKFGPGESFRPLSMPLIRVARLSGDGILFYAGNFVLPNKIGRRHDYHHQLGRGSVTSGRVSLLPGTP
jgi:hypothetical protein